jgi:hypothetical protein
MKSLSKTKVAAVIPAKTTVAAIVRELTAIGHPLSRQQVSKDVANGAPTTSAVEYLAWKSANEQRAPRRSGGNATLAKLREEKIRKEIELLTERHLAEKRENQVRAGELVERAQVRSDMDKAANKAVAVLVQKFETELPPKQDGMPADKIAEMNRAAIYQVRLILSQPGTYAD